MKILRYTLILFISFLSFSCSDEWVSPNTEDEDDPIIIVDPDSSTVESDSTHTI